MKKTLVLTAILSLVSDVTLAQSRMTGAINSINMAGEVTFSQIEVTLPKGHFPENGVTVVNHGNGSIGLEYGQVIAPYLAQIDFTSAIIDIIQQAPTVQDQVLLIEAFQGNDSSLNGSGGLE